MMVKQHKVRALYRKLLTLYPREFRESVGESMEQSFNDLWIENRRVQNDRFGFVFWIFMETGMGLVREYAMPVMEGNAMRNMLFTLRSPAMISLILVVPFMIMELVNRQSFQEGFPFPLFVILWFLPLLFIVILMPVVQNIRMGNSIMAHPIQLLIRVILLILIAFLWMGILIDQMPCFLGVPNCD